MICNGITCSVNTIPIAKIIIIGFIAFGSIIFAFTRFFMFYLPIVSRYAKECGLTNWQWIKRYVLLIGR